MSRSDNYIVNYSYYGDWASPSYACMSEVCSVKVTPGELMSTGYSYLNCKMLHEFALILDKEEDAEYFKEVMEKIKRRFLRSGLTRNRVLWQQARMQVRLFLCGWA